MLAKEDHHTPSKEAKTKGREKLARADEKHFRRRGFKEGLLRRGKFKELRGKARDEAIAKAAHHTRTSGQDQSRRMKRMVRDFQKPQEGAKIPGKTAVVVKPSVPKSLSAKEQLQLLSRFKRTGRLPSKEELLAVYLAIERNPVDPGVGVSNRRRLLEVMHKKLLAEGIEPNPGPPPGQVPLSLEAALLFVPNSARTPFTAAFQWWDHVALGRMDNAHLRAWIKARLRTIELNPGPGGRGGDRGGRQKRRGLKCVRPGDPRRMPIGSPPVDAAKGPAEMPAASSSAPAAPAPPVPTKPAEPHPAEGGVIRNQVPHARRGGFRRKGKGGVNALIDQIAGEIEKEQGAADAKKEKAEEMSEEAKAAAVKKAEAEKEAQRAAHLAAAGNMPRVCAFHPFRFGDDVTWQDVAPVKEELRLCVWPHRICEVQLDGVVPAVELRDPHNSEVRLPRGNFHIARYRCRIQNRSFFNHVVQDPALDERTVFISPEIFALARSRRIAQYCTFAQGVERVRSFRAAHPDFSHDSRDPRSTGEFNDQVFTALLMVETNGLSNSLVLDLLMNQGLDVLRHAVLTDPANPMVAGNYVRGYHVTASELFAAPINGARAAVRAGVPVRVAATWAADKIVAAGTAIHESGRRAREGVEDRLRRSWEYCRGLPVQVEGIVPSFPDPVDSVSNVLAACKRLLRRVELPTDEARTYLTAMGAIVVDKIANSPNRHADMSMTQLIDAALAKVHEETQWSQDQKECFLAGARQFVDGDINTCLDQLRIYSVFIKQETYDITAAKAARYIVAPAHYARGVLFAACHAAELHIRDVFSGHLVKGLRVPEIAEKLREAFVGCKQVFESDYSSFESLIDEFAQKTCEIPAFVAAAPVTIRERTRAVLTFMAENRATLKGAGLTLLAPIIRYSGTYQTSSGNGLENIVKSFSALALAARIPVSRLREWFDSYRRPWLVEGDDGAFDLDGIPLADVVEAHKKCGHTVTAEVHSDVNDAAFCGLRQLFDGTIFKDPLDVLSRLTHWLGADRGTGKYDLDMLVSKAISYGMLYGRLPLVGPLCRAIVRKFRPRVDKIRDHLRIWSEAEQRSSDLRPTAGELLLRRFMQHKAGGDVEALFRWIDEPSVPVSVFAREETQRLWRHLTDGAQRAAEAAFESSISAWTVVDGRAHSVIEPLVLKLPSISEPWERMARAKGITMRFLEGRRERAAAMVDAASSTVNSALTGLGRVFTRERTLKYSTVLNWIVGLVTISALVMAVQAIWLFVALVGAIAILGVAAVLGVWVFLGINPRWSLFGVRVASWSFIGLLSVRWVKRYWRPCEAEAAAAPPLADGAHVTEVTPAPLPSGVGAFFASLRRERH